MTQTATFALTACLFFLSVYGLANAISVLKIGRYFIGQGYCFAQDCTALDHPLDKRRGLGTIPYLGDLLYCPPCISFWWGMLTSIFLISPASLVIQNVFKSAFIDGLAACAMSYLIHVSMEKMSQGVETL